MLKEIWVQLKENKYYEISNYGRIKSKCVSCKTGKVRYGYYWEYYK